MPIKPLPTDSRFQVRFSPSSFGTGSVFFLVDKNPRYPALGEAFSPSIVLTETTLNIVTGANVTLAQPFTPKNVDNHRILEGWDSPPAR